MSRARIFIPTANPRELGEQFILRLYLSEGKPIEVPCKVIFTNKYGKESQNLRRGMGIKFLDLPPEVQRQLEEHLQTYQNRKFQPSQHNPSPPSQRMVRKRNCRAIPRAQRRVELSAGRTDRLSSEKTTGMRRS